MFEDIFQSTSPSPGAIGSIKHPDEVTDERSGGEFNMFAAKFMQKVENLISDLIKNQRQTNSILLLLARKVDMLYTKIEGESTHDDALRDEFNDKGMAEDDHKYARANVEEKFGQCSSPFAYSVMNQKSKATTVDADGVDQCSQIKKLHKSRGPPKLQMDILKQMKIGSNPMLNKALPTAKETRSYHLFYDPITSENPGTINGEEHGVTNEKEACNVPETPSIVGSQGSTKVTQGRKREAPSSSMANSRKASRAENAKTIKATVLDKQTYKRYLHLLTKDEGKVCNKLANCRDQTAVAFKMVGYDDYMSVVDCLSIFPDNYLKDVVIDMFLFICQNKINCRRPTRVYLPTAFQRFGITLEDGDTGNNDGYCRYTNMHSKSYIPADFSMVDEVYIPMNDPNGKHWFLIVLKLSEKRVYVLDSSGPIPRRCANASQMLIAAEKHYGKHTRLGKFFCDASKWQIIPAPVPIQPNHHDCGMYVIKYCEAAEFNAWTTIYYKSEVMRVMRLKYISNLLNSPSNEAINFIKSIKGLKIRSYNSNK